MTAQSLIEDIRNFRMHAPDDNPYGMSDQEMAEIEEAAEYCRDDVIAISEALETSEYNTGCSWGPGVTVHITPVGDDFARTDIDIPLEVFVY